MTEEKLALALRGRGFDLIEFSDPVEFRYAYEYKYRSIWDRGEHTDLVAGGRDAFVTPGDTIVGHGGVAIEEVIVPLVRFVRRTR